MISFPYYSRDESGSRTLRNLIGMHFKDLKFPISLAFQCNDIYFFGALIIYLR